MNKIIYHIVVSCAVIFLGCAPSKTINPASPIVYDGIPMRTYTTFWFDAADSVFAHPGDSITFTLYKQSSDTLAYSPWSSPGTTLIYVLKQDNVVSLELISIDRRKRTKPIQETLEAGSYKFTFTSNTMQSGVYFWQRSIGRDTTMKKLLFMK